MRQLLEDVNSEFAAADRDVDSEYFIGTIVTCLADNGVHQLIDGQQRMTTAYIVLCAIRDCWPKLNASEIQAFKPQIAASSIDKLGRDIFRYRVTLQYQDSSGGMIGAIRDCARTRRMTGATVTTARSTNSTPLSTPQKAS